MDEEKWFVWGVACVSNNASGGMADTYEKAHRQCMEAKNRFEDEGQQVKAYAIYDKNDVCVLAGDVFR